MYAKYELSEKNGTITTNLNVSTVIFTHVVRVIPIASTSVLGVRIEYTMSLRGVDSSGFTPKSGLVSAETTRITNVRVASLCPIWV